MLETTFDPTSTNAIFCNRIPGEKKPQKYIKFHEYSMILKNHTFLMLFQNFIYLLLLS